MDSSSLSRFQALLLRKEGHFDPLGGRTYYPTDFGQTVMRGKFFSTIEEISGIAHGARMHTITGGVYGSRF